MLYINFQHHSLQYEFGGQSLTFSDAMELMEIHAPKIEKLVLTQSDYDLPDDPTLGSYSLPIKFTNLTSLSISSYYLGEKIISITEKRYIRSCLHLW